MAEEISVENGRISNFEGLVTLTLTRVILHTVVYHSSTSTYMPNFIEIEETFWGRTDGRTYNACTDEWTDIWYRGFIISTQKSWPKMGEIGRLTFICRRGIHKRSEISQFRFQNVHLRWSGYIV